MTTVATANNPITRPASAVWHVKEFFLYSYPHCFQIEPRLETGVRQLQSDIQFGDPPVLFGRSSRTYARIDYTERTLGVVARLQEKVFDVINRHH